MPKAATTEAEILRRQKISAALKGITRGPREALVPDVRGKISARMKNIWANRSDSERTLIGDKISRTRTELYLVPNAEEKRCNTCDRVLPRQRFSGDGRNRDGLFGRCLDCQGTAMRSWQSANPDKVRFFRRRRYGIKFDELWDLQKGLCAICSLPMLLQGQQPASVCVDHDHACCQTLAKSCGKCVRGLIHSNCNRMLGQAKDDPDLLELGAAYLRRWRQSK